MTDDRELLEAAARAAGMRVRWCLNGVEGDERECFIDLDTGARWEPQDDDGAALRLACALTITVQFPWDERENPLRETQCWTGDYEPIVELHNGDVAAATRRAIVRAAAAIGKGMKPPAPTLPDSLSDEEHVRGLEGRAS